MMRKALLVMTILLVSLSSTLHAQNPDTTPPALPDEASELLIRVWLPDGLYAAEDDDAVAVLEDQIERFNRMNAQYDVELRLKPDSGTGSILTTLIAAQPVAPSAIPDLVLLLRQR